LSLFLGLSLGRRPGSWGMGWNFQGRIAERKTEGRESIAWRSKKWQ
jgi:hypothetical protein